MVQLNLPRGSKPTAGKVHKAPAGAKNVKTYKVYRYDPCLLYTSDAADE